MKKKRRVEAGVRSSVYGTASGYGGVVASDAGLLEVFLPQTATAAEMKSLILGLYPRATEEDSLTREAAVLLREYFSGKRVRFELPLDLGDCTGFQRTVYEAVSGIPYGSVNSYGEVACRINRPGASRGIGSAMAGNPLPIIVPCHRVIGSDGKMTGYSAPGGTELKMRLLLMEGVEPGGGKKKSGR